MPLRILILLSCLFTAHGQAGAHDRKPIRGTDIACTLQNRYVRYVIGADGRNVEFADRRTGRNYAAPDAPFARVKKDGKEYPATQVSFADGKLTVTFGDSGVRAVLKPTVLPHYLTLEVLSVTGEGAQELSFADIPLTLKGDPGEPFAGCALALNLQTNVNELPRANSRLRALCYTRFGFAGAKVALLGCPTGQLRKAMQEVVAAAPDLPHSPIGGPWALGQKINQGSYLFNFGDMTEQKADDWIKLARRLGMNQIDFHGGGSFRFGDCEPNPQTYPRGRASLKAVVDKLHAAGIQAGLHTYAFFIDKRCPWVTPVPDPRLAKDATFTLAADLPADEKTVPVTESTQSMSAVTGFFVRNSVTLQIDEELIVYTGVQKEPPFAFTGCTRGAYGTRIAAHKQGAKVHHLKECFGLFVPDPDTTLFQEVAAKTAETFNECGFDMIYLDALDGEDILGGPENAWHYGSQFVFEIWKRLKWPALMEMSTFHHHLWYVRSRMGAWDHPTRSHKAFIDIHCKANEENARMFLPGQLGWWAVKTWSGPQGEPTFADDIEYLMAKCLGTDTGFALMGIDPNNFDKVPALPRLAAIIKRWEDLRHAGKVPESVRAKLRAPGAEYTLALGPKGVPQLLPIVYAKHRVEGAWSEAWKVTNRFERQPLRLRIEALMAAADYNSPDGVTLSDSADFSTRAAAPGVTADLQPSPRQDRPAVHLTATNSSASPLGAWAKMEKTFALPLDLSGRQALGVRVYGDGQGEVLNLQLRSPSHIVAGIGDHYIVVDFTGWRYFELIEPEGSRWADYQWPYGDPYSIYRESVAYGQVATLGLWLNNLPAGKKVACDVGPIRALPLAPTKLIHPSVTIGGKTVVFPVEIESGSYLEYNGPEDCKLYGPQGELLRAVTPQGDTPLLEPGENAVTFRCGAPQGVSARAYVTVITHGKPLRASR
jgi:hypothetical protein